MQYRKGNEIENQQGRVETWSCQKIYRGVIFMEWLTGWHYIHYLSTCSPTSIIISPLLFRSALSCSQNYFWHCALKTYLGTISIGKMFSSLHLFSRYLFVSRLANFFLFHFLKMQFALEMNLSFLIHFRLYCTSSSHQWLHQYVGHILMKLQ